MNVSSAESNGGTSHRQERPHVQSTQRSPEGSGHEPGRQTHHDQQSEQDEQGHENERQAVHAAGGGQVVLVAGGTARTAEAVLRRFLELEFRVATTVRDRSRMAETLARLPDNGTAVQVIETDLLEDGGAEHAVAQVMARFGRLDAVTTLVGGGFSARPFAETSLDDLRRAVEGNLYSTYTLCRAALPPMLARGGGYVATVAGGSALDPGYGRGLFGASKAAVVTLTKGIARDHKQQGIRANCLVAGTIATPEARRYLNDEELHAASTLREFADALVFLCSPAASGLSGAVIELNGREID